MKTVLLFLLLPVLAFTQTNIGGVLSSDTTLLLANSPYIVTNNLLVQQGKKVVVEPGVVFKFNQGIYLQVDGEFQAIGTAADSILFTVNTAGGGTAWAGIRFTDICTNYNQSTGSGCRLDYCILEKVSDFGTTRTILVQNCIVQVSSCELRNLTADGIVVPGSGYCRIINSKIHDCTGIAIWSTDNSGGLIQGNEIFNCYSSGEAIDIGKANFIGNYVHDIGSPLAIRVWNTSIINSNIIENNKAAILLSGGDSHIIKCNTFNNNFINLVITCERHPIVTNNNFLNYKDWDVLWTAQYLNYGDLDCSVPSGSGVYATIDLSNNYWGGITNAQMDSSIWDFNDDFSLKALIDYSPTIPDTVDFANVNCSTITAVNESTIKNENVSPFPNPFSNQLTFSLAHNAQTTVSLYNFLGQQVLQQTTFTNITTLNTEQLANGIYFYQLMNGKQIIKSGKLIKQ